jgi:hypothetical protein
MALPKNAIQKIVALLVRLTGTSPRREACEAYFQILFPSPIADPIANGFIIFKYRKRGSV